MGESKRKLMSSGDSKRGRRLTPPGYSGQQSSNPGFNPFSLFWYKLRSTKERERQSGSPVSTLFINDTDRDLMGP